MPEHFAPSHDRGDGGWRADHHARRHCMPGASRCLEKTTSGASRDLKGRTVGVLWLAVMQRLLQDHGLVTSGSIRQRTSGGSRALSARAYGPLHRGQDRCVHRRFRRHYRNCARRNIGHVIVEQHHGSSMVAVFLLHVGDQHGICPQKYPIATKRVVRAILKAADLCASAARSEWHNCWSIVDTRPL